MQGVRHLAFSVLEKKETLCREDGFLHLPCQIAVVKSLPEKKQLRQLRGIFLVTIWLITPKRGAIGMVKSTEVV